VKYLIFSDVHGNYFSFLRFLEDINSLSFDKIIFLGDFVGYYYEPEPIINYCIDNNVTCLLGNHDSYFLDMIDGKLKESYLVSKYGFSYSRAKETITDRSINFLRGLSPCLAHSPNNSTKIFFCHGSPNNHINGRIYPDTDLSSFEKLTTDFDYIVFGHTHHKMQKIYENTFFLNPGSLGQQRDGTGCSYMLLDTEIQKAEIRVIKFNIDLLDAQINFYDNGSERLKSVLRRLN